MSTNFDTLAPPTRRAIRIFTVGIWILRTELIVLNVCIWRLGQGAGLIFGLACGLVGWAGLEYFAWMIRRSIRAAQNDERYKT